VIKSTNIVKTHLLFIIIAETINQSKNFVLVTIINNNKVNNLDINKIINKA